MLRTIAVSILILIMVPACTTTPTDPTPFIASDKRIIVVGCEQLREEVAEWNSTHPELPPKKADC